MPRKHASVTAKFCAIHPLSYRIAIHLLTTASLLTLGGFAAGCHITPLAKPAAAFANSAASLVSATEDAYQAAIDLHDQEQISAAVIAVEKGVPWVSIDLKPLITPEGLKNRALILDGLKTYAQAISNLQGDVDSPALSNAASSTGANLKTLGNTIHTDLTGAKSGLLLSSESANIVSTATLALGEYLIASKIKTALPEITTKIDPQVAALCKQLTGDIEILRQQSKKDYDDLWRQQWRFIADHRDKLSPVELRTEIEKLPAIRKDQLSTDAKLGGLAHAIDELALTHHALATAAQGNNPQSFSERIADLASVASNLGNFYHSLPQ
jgi:hypothetical protein